MTCYTEEEGYNLGVAEVDCELALLTGNCIELSLVSFWAGGHQNGVVSQQHTAYSIQHTAHSIQHVSWQQAELCRAEKEMTDQKEMADVVFAEMSATPHASDCGDYSSPNYWQPLSRVLPFATCPANTAAPDDLCRDGHVQSLTNGNFPVSVANLSSCNSTCTVLLARTIRYARKTSSAL